MYLFFVIFKAIKPEKFELEYAVPYKCAADQKTSDTGVYAGIKVEESDHPLPHVSDDEKVSQTYSQPLFEKMDRSPDIDFSEPTRQDETKLDEQDFDEEDVEVLFHKPCVDSDKEEVPLVPPQREVSCTQ